MNGTMRRWLLLSGLGLLATAAGAWRPRDLPLLVPGGSGTYRLDALLDQAEVNGPDLADFDSDWVVHEVLPDDFRKATAAAAPAVPAGVPLPPSSSPASPGAPTVAEVEWLDDAVRLGGTGSPTFCADLPGLERDAIDLLVVKARAHGVDRFRLQVVADESELGNRGFPGMSGVMIGPDQATRSAPGEVEIPDDGEWHTLTVSLQRGPSTTFGAGPASGGTARCLGLTVPAGDEPAWLDVAFVHLMDPRLHYAAAAAAPTTVRRDGVTHLGLHVWTLTDLTWRLVVPDGARFRTDVTAIDDRPFTLTLSASGEAGRSTLFEQTFEGAAAPQRVDVDLAPLAGQDVRLTIEVVEEGEPTVALLLRPMVTAPAAERPPNVLMYFCDTLRADGLSCYGNPRGTTPRLDRLAQEGIQFRRCFAQGSWTYVSMPSVLTSLLPSANGVRSGGTRVPDSVTTVAEQFRAEGYLTAAFITNDFVGETTHTEQGFDYFFPDNAVRRGAVAPADGAAGGALGFLAPGQGVGGGFSSGSSRAIAVCFERWLAENGDVPIFVVLHAVDPHEPYDPEEAYARRYLTEEEEAAYRQDEAALNQARMERMQAPGGQGSVVFRAAAGGNAPAGAVVQFVPPVGQGAPVPTQAPPQPGDPVATDVDPPEPRAVPSNPREELASLGLEPDLHADRMRALYDAEVAYLDDWFGRVLDLLDQRGLSSRTVVSFHADHGEEFLDHDRFGHGQSLYAELIGVPWILRLPGGAPAGVVIDDPVANLDVGPTLLGLCGLAAHPDMQGRNLAAALCNEEPIAPAPILAERWGGESGSVAVIQGRFKTILDVQESNGEITVRTARGTGDAGAHVYDLEADGMDRLDLAGQHGSQLERLTAWVTALLTEQRAFRERHGARPDQVDPASLEMLRALGYVK